MTHYNANTKKKIPLVIKCIMNSTYIIMLTIHNAINIVIQCNVFS